MFSLLWSSILLSLNRTWKTDTASLLSLTDWCSSLAARWYQALPSVMEPFTPPTPKAKWSSSSSILQTINPSRWLFSPAPLHLWAQAFHLFYLHSRLYELSSAGLLIWESNDFFRVAVGVCVFVHPSLLVMLVRLCQPWICILVGWSGVCVLRHLQLGKINIFMRPRVLLLREPPTFIFHFSNFVYSAQPFFSSLHLCLHFSCHLSITHQ